MRIMHPIFASAVMVALASSAVTSRAAGQLANASATTLALGGNATATSRGIAAISMNPAGLAMPGSGFTLALVPLQIRSGLDPVTLKDIKDFEGRLIPAATKEEWLSRVDAGGGQSGSFGIDVSGLALSVGPVGFQVSTLASGSMNLAPDILELILYGNAGRTGQPADLSLSGSTLDAFGITTGALSFAVPIPGETGTSAIGATLKYSVGHGLIAGRDQGGTVQSDPIRVDLNFPVVSFDDEDAPLQAGSGLGLDVGFQTKRDRLSFGAAVQNLFNTFGWDESKLVFRPGTALLEQDENETDFDKRPFSAAPAGLQQVVTDMTFDPVVAVGVGYDFNEDFTVSGDVRNRFGDGLDIGPKLHAGVGAEFRGLKVLELRGGAALITDGVELGGGASLVLGPVSLSAAGAFRKGDLEDTSIAQFTLSFGGR